MRRPIYSKELHRFVERRLLPGELPVNGTLICGGAFSCAISNFFAPSVNRAGYLVAGGMLNGKAIDAGG